MARLCREEDITVRFAHDEGMFPDKLWNNNIIDIRNTVSKLYHLSYTHSIYDMPKPEFSLGSKANYKLYQTVQYLHKLKENLNSDLDLEHKKNWNTTINHNLDKFDMEIEYSHFQHARFAIEPVKVIL